MGRPLSRESMHSPAVHLSWPFALRRRIDSLCSLKADRLKHYDAMKKLLWQGNASTKSFNDEAPRHINNNRFPDRVLRYLVIPYNFMIRGLSLHRVVDSIRDRWACEAGKYGVTLPNVQTSWRLGNAHLCDV